MTVIISTVVLMFWYPYAIPDVIENITYGLWWLQLNVYMSTEDAMPRTSLRHLASGELKDYYVVDIV